MDEESSAWIIIEAMEQNMMRQDFLVFGGAITVLFLLGILGSVHYPLLNDWLQRNPNHATVLSADPACNPVGGLCTAGDATLTVTLGLGGSIQPLTAFPVEVNLIGREAAKVNKVAVNFSMSNMDMGFNRFDLSRQADKTWRGHAILPVCSMGRREWRVAVEVVSDTTYLAEFNLLAGSSIN
ncbi:MAG: hypothetical protein RKO24_06590 [Candidatus Competibacter sp.]|nr:hypothetical protein [Candidatus Competibacter sp.]